MRVVILVRFALELNPHQKSSVDLITALRNGTIHEACSAMINQRTLHEQETIPIPSQPMHSKYEKKQEAFLSPLHPDKRLGFAIVGLGNLSLGQLLPAFGQCRFCKPVAIVSGNGVKASRVAEQYGIEAKNIYNYQNFDFIRNNSAVDIVYIVLPNGMHEEYSIRAFAAGKHVLCEKPMANNVAEARRMIEASERAKKKLMIAYRIQYEPGNKIIKDWIRNQTHGKVKIIESFNGQDMGDAKQWRLNKRLAGGGALPDIGLYCINTARYQLGTEPVWASAFMYRTPGDRRFNEVEESVSFQLGFPGGEILSAVTS